MALAEEVDMFRFRCALRRFALLLGASCFSLAQSAFAEGDAPPPSLPAAHDAPMAEAGASVHRRVHDGFYFRGSVGYAGAYDFSAQRTLEGAPTSGASYPLGFGYEALFGGTYSHIWGGPGSLILGGGIEVLMSKASAGGSHDGGKPTFSAVAPVAFVDYYPSARRGLHLQALLGPTLTMGACENGCFTDTSAGVLGGAGIGYDAWLSDEWSLGLLGRVQYTHVVGMDSHEVHDALMPTLTVSAAYN